jgi:hypothetical protein
MKSLERLFVKCMTSTWIAGPVVLMLFAAMALGVGWILDSTRVLERHQAVAALHPVLPGSGPYSLAQGEIPARLEISGGSPLEGVLQPSRSVRLAAGGHTLQARVLGQMPGSSGAASIREPTGYILGIKDEAQAVQALFGQGLAAMEIAVRGEKLWKAAIKKTGLSTLP